MFGWCGTQYETLKDMFALIGLITSISISLLLFGFALYTTTMKVAAFLSGCSC